MLTTTQRGYGYTHQRERARWAKVVDAGEAMCAETYCYHSTRWIQPGTKWQLAHDHEHGGYKGPAHQLCNRREEQIRAGWIAPPSDAPSRWAL